MCLPSDALLQHLPSYLGFSYLGRGVYLHSCSSKAQLLLLILDEGYLLTTPLPDLHRGIAPLGPPAPAQPRSLDTGLGLQAAAPGLGVGLLLLATAPDLGCRVTPLVDPPDLRRGVAPLGCSLAISAWHSAAAPDLGRGVTPLGCRPSGIWSSQFLPLTSDVGWLLSTML